MLTLEAIKERAGQCTVNTGPVRPGHLVFSDPVRLKSLLKLNFTPPLEEGEIVHATGIDVGREEFRLREKIFWWPMEYFVLA